MQWLFLLSLICVLAGCGSNEHPRSSASSAQSGGARVIRRVGIQPESPSCQDTLRVLVDGREGDKSLQYQWLRSGQPIPGAIRPLLAPSYFSPGDIISVRVAAPSQRLGSEAAESPLVVIKSSIPQVTSVELKPVPAFAGDTLEVSAKARSCGEEVNTFSYEWLINDEPHVEIIGPTLSPDQFRRGDVIQVKVSAVTGEGTSPALSSRAVVIQNGLPKILSSPPDTVEDGLYRYQVVARDPEDDPLTYTLRGKSPEGMEIDRQSGLLEWRVPDKPAQDTYEFEVVVDDGHKGLGIQKIVLRLPPAK